MRFLVLGKNCRMLWLIALVLMSAVPSRPAFAHAMAPALLQLEETAPGEYQVLWRLSVFQTSRKLPHPQFPANCVPTQAAKVSPELGGAMASRWTVQCAQPGLIGQTLAVSGLQRSNINVIVHISSLDGRQIDALLASNRDHFVVPASTSSSKAFGHYFKLGVEHLLLGLDHLLMVLGLILLVRGWRMLLLTLSAFTLGHSVTLSLAALDLIQFNQALMEFAIAVSLVVLARELLHKRPSLLSRYPALLAVCFGLLHGLGFAGALNQIGLPREAIVGALLGFNLGIEAAQIMLVCGVALVVAVMTGLAASRADAMHAALRPRVRLLAAYLIGSCSMLWCYQRVLLI